MQLAQILSLKAISLSNTASSKKKVLEEASLLLAGDSFEATEDTVYEGLLERERLGSTGVGHGVALPHARIKGLSMPRGAFIRLDESADFDAIDGEPVDLVFALIVPEETTEAHLQLLAQLAALFSEPRNRRTLRDADSADEVLDHFRHSDPDDHAP